jgi:hypothetical protein
MRGKESPMNRKLFFATSLCIVFSSGASCLAGTVSAGTPILVRTNAAISTHATPGNHFTATLEQGLGSVAAGAQLSGVIEASRGSRSTTSSKPLTLRLTAISKSGRLVVLKTDAVMPQGAKTTRARRGGFSFGEDTFPVGTKLEFHLTQPVNL